MAPASPSADNQIHLYWTAKGYKPVTNEAVSRAIKIAAAAVRSETGIDPAKVSASSFRPGGATALLCGRIDKNTIKLLGRWRSDAIDTYLRTQAAHFGASLSATILDNGSFTFIHQPTVVDDCNSLEHGLPDGTTKAMLKDYITLLMTDLFEEAPDLAESHSDNEVSAG